MYRDEVTKEKLGYVILIHNNGNGYNALHYMVDSFPKRCSFESSRSDKSRCIFPLFCLSVCLSLSLSFSLSLSLFLSYVSELPYYNDRLNMEACHLCDTTARNDVKRDTRGISLTFDAMSENMKHTGEK